MPAELAENAAIELEGDECQSSNPLRLENFAEVAQVRIQQNVWSVIAWALQFLAARECVQRLPSYTRSRDWPGDELHHAA
ncbi:MAG: hypothetical protein ACRD8O_09845 [Bryobacteraceae bacterium]